jgi:hypothetical protein
MIPLEAHAWVVDWSQAATGGLIAAVWQGILLAAAAGLGLRFLPKTPAAVRFAIWFGVFVVVAGLPVCAFWPHAASAASAGGHAPWLVIDERWCLTIAAIWAVVSLVRAGTLVAAALRVRALWRRATPVPVEAGGANGLQPTPRGKAKDGPPRIDGAVGRRAQICTSDEVDRPTVIGFFAPKILIPAWLLERLSPAELEQIVLHEAGHLGRADDWMNLLQKIALVVFPLNPALAWVERRLCFERELACDERVLRATGAPKAYAACLATLAEYRLGRRGVALALGALGRESELAQRVGRILRRGDQMKPVHAKLLLGGAMLGMLGGVTMLARCPQVVGFAAESEIADAGAKWQRTGTVETGIREQGSEIRAAANGNGYKSVVFHQGAEQGVRASGLVVRMRSSEAHGAAGSTPPQRPTVLSETSAKDRGPGFEAVQTSAREGALDRQQRGNGGRLVQWVQVMSWENADGSRLVLTTVRTSGDVEGSIVQGRAAGLQRQADADQPQPDQVHPYAAVPVQGGWLVFQL